MLDVERRVLVVNVEPSAEVNRFEADLDGIHPPARLRRICGSGAEVLICGAVSRPLETALLSAGMRVLPQTCGPVEDVLRAFLSGRLNGHTKENRDAHLRIPV